MKAPPFALIALWVIATLVALVGCDSLGCTGVSVENPIGSDNWYCSPVTRITYQGVGGDSFYPLVTQMNGETGQCLNISQPFSGKMSPLDEDVSVHFRGPLVLKQFAVYVPTSQPAKRSVNSRHGHRHSHPKLEMRHQNRNGLSQDMKRDVGDWITATVNGDVVSWMNQYDGEAACAVPVTATIDGVVVSWINNYCGPSTTGTTSSTVATSVVFPASGTTSSTTLSTTATTTSQVPDTQSAATTPQQLPPAAPTLAASSSVPSVASNILPGEVLGSGAWDRIAYYNADTQNASGVTFLNNNGGNNGSGTCDSFFGNSLSFANEQSNDGSPEPVIFGGELTGNFEVAIFSSNDCTEEDSCGYWRPGAVAYQGFAGSEKAFLMEFSMPDDGNDILGYNMPAIWFLNAKIPRTQQYGTCSCWPPCGEFDAFEILTPGFDMMKATLHGNVSGGVSDYIVRPTNGTMKGAVVFNDNNIIIQILDDNYDFPESLSLDEVNALTVGTSDNPGTDWVLTS